MSLIQEALRRQQEEAEGKGKPAGAAQPPVQPPGPVAPPPAGLKLASAPPAPAPAPAAVSAAQPPEPPPPPEDIRAEAETSEQPVAAAEEGTEQAAKPGKTLLVVGIVLVILVVGAVAGIVFLVNQFSDPPAPDQVAENVPVSPAEPTQATTTSPAAPVADTTAASVAPVLPVSEPDESATVDETTPTQPAPAVKPIWPVLTLSGIAGNKTSGGAILNGEIIAVNETIQGVRVKAIRSRAVELEYKGEIRVLDVGGSTQ